MLAGGGAEPPVEPPVEPPDVLLPVLLPITKFAQAILVLLA